MDPDGAPMAPGAAAGGRATDPAGGDASPPASAGPAGPPGDAAAGDPGRLVLIGTGHVFRIAQEIRGAIHAVHPDIVFVELDRGRLRSLLAKRRGAEPQKASGFVHKRLQRFQEGVASMYGGEVGEEMLAAVQAGQEVGAEVRLIDPPADATLRRALKEMRLREWLRLGGMAVQGTFKAIWPGGKKRSRAALESELKRYQEDPASALTEIEDQFPTVYRIVIAERDELMARRIRNGLAGRRVGVAVVGDGHVNGILEHLEDLDVTSHRLRAVREGTLPKPPGWLAVGTPDRVSFGFETQA